jgi:DNA mismatch repair protein MSH2
MLTGSCANVALRMWLAAHQPYTKPKVAEKGAENLKFLEATHPCLEVQDDLIFMVNDIQMDKGS